MREYEKRTITSVEELHMFLGNVVEVYDGSDIRCEMYQNVWLRRMGDNILSDGAVLYRCHSDGFQGTIGVNSYKSLEELPADFSKTRSSAAVLLATACGFLRSIHPAHRETPGCQATR